MIDRRLAGPSGNRLGARQRHNTWYRGHGLQPHFYRSGRLLVLYLGDDPLVLETMSLILGPQVAGR